MKKKKNLLLALLCCAGVTVSAQSYSLRTNVLGLATTNLNVEASMTLSRKWSFHLPVQYNPFKFSKNRQFRNFYVAPGVRYWLLQSYIGGFVGVYGTAGLIDGMITRIAEELNESEDQLTVIATGGVLENIPSRCARRHPCGPESSGRRCRS